ncbi:MAG: ankyrin repeat domain-containing protein [Acidimicrobiia bacterium]|nr:ankyrin repeat domain-containing protein [Acidimicrobiia bacterium]
MDELVRACAAGNYDRVLELLTGTDPPDLDAIQYGRAPLAHAGSVEVVEVLLGAGASVDSMAGHDDVLQVIVSEASSLRTVPERVGAARLLLAAGARLDRRDAWGNTRLWTAAFSGDADAVEALLTLGLAAEDDPAPLAAACWGSGDEHTERIVDLLVSAGADPARRDLAGWSAVHGAAMPYSHGDGFESSDGASPTALRALHRAGASLDVAGPGGTTALMLAAEGGELEALATLLELGADRRRRDGNGATAADRARVAAASLAGVLADADPSQTPAVQAALDRVNACIVRLAP